ncbi:TPA: LamG domain-containing protein [Candidatus Poribacteria bacterium]|nr:LamG domain-containing protein [Candidatus Poribacteria bacterium]
MRKITIMIFISLLCSLSISQVFGAVTMDDTIGFWLFDEGKGDIAKDSSKNGNNGKLIDNPTWVNGKFGQALSFDVEGPFVKIDVPRVQLNSWTAMVWINPFKTKAGHFQGLIQAWPNGGEFQIDSNGAVGVHPVYGGSLKDKEWAHVAVRIDNGSSQVYINGKEVIKGTVPPVTFVQIGIGDLYAVPAGFNYKYTGIIDEVAIFNRAIAENDILEIMNKGLGKIMGVTEVSSSDKIASTWGKIKS